MSTATSRAPGLSPEQLEQYGRDGFVRVSGFADADVCAAMLETVVGIARARAAGEKVHAYVQPEANLADKGGLPEELVSKIFLLHREHEVFHQFAVSDRVTAMVADLIAPDLDCFLSQFIFKNPGAWGQPWHQDSFYFPFEPARPITGVWLAITEATLENGCLHVLPGSHREPVHEHIRDMRPGANSGYVEIVDHDMTGSIPVLMEPGDLLLFDSHLMHRSTDNTSAGIRAAMVYHYAAAGTVERRGPNPINDFMPARRSG